jgi:uncharacterized membrane protein
MAYCSKCGAQVPEGAAFCQKCGAPQPASPASAVRSGLSPNTAALLSYVLGWITGLIFYFIDNRPYVRFHAAQSIITFGGLHIIRAVLGIWFGVGWWFGPGHGHRFGPGWPLLSLIGLLSFVLWILLMVKAYQGQKFKIPIAGDLAENLTRQ